MIPLTKATIDGFNEYIGNLKNDKQEAELTTVTLVKANSTARVEYVAKPLLEVGPLEYTPLGATPLYDSIGKGVEELSKLVAPEDTAIVIVQTDGYENASTEFDHATIMKLIKDKEATNKWTFVYLGADQNAFEAGTSMGFSGGNSYNYSASGQSVGAVYAAASVGTQTLRSAKAQGMTASTTFLQDAGVDEEDLKGGTDGSTSSEKS